MRRVLIAAGVGAAALALGACDGAHPRELVGQWRSNVVDDRVITRRITTLRLEADGTGQYIDRRIVHGRWMDRSAPRPIEADDADTAALTWRVSTVEDGRKRLCLSGEAFGQVECGVVEATTSSLLVRWDTGQPTHFDRESPP